MRTRSFSPMGLLALTAWLLSSCSGGDSTAPSAPTTPTTGIVRVECSPSSITAGWQLTGPESFLYVGYGCVRLPNLKPGSYTIMWPAVATWHPPTPNPESMMLAAGDSILFTGQYFRSETVTIDPSPDNLNAPWTLTGPTAEFSATGTGDRVLPQMLAGTYRITWGTLNGYVTPSVQSRVLEFGGAIVFQATYLQYGTVIVRPEPSNGASYTITGPGGFERENQYGVHTYGQCVPGPYIVHWMTSWGYVPDDKTESKYLPAGGQVEFTKTFQPAASFSISPDYSVAGTTRPAFPTWRVTGPNGFSASGQQFQTFWNAPIGLYTVAWGDARCWTRTSPATSSHDMVQGQQLYIFTADYIQIAGCE